MRGLSGRWRWIAAVAAVLALVVVAGGWVMAAGQARDAVTVRPAGPVRCTGADVGKVRMGHPERRLVAIPLRPGMRCSVPVRIENTGRRGVTVHTVVLPYMGAKGGAAVRVREFEGMPVPVGQQGDVDAVFPVAKRIAAGEHWTVEVVHTFRARGCTARGTFTTDLLTARVSSLGRSGTRTTGRVVAFRGTRHSECGG